MIWVDDPVAEVARIAERGLDPVDVERHDIVWKYVFRDADGNEIGVGGDVTGPSPASPTTSETREHARLGSLCGRIAKDRVEALTDELAVVPYEVLDTAELDELAAALELLAQQLIAAQDWAEHAAPGGNGPSKPKIEALRGAR
jgi:hypothetical protein